MQWLFNIVVEMMWNSIHSLGIYRDRGTYDGADFTQVDLTADATWRELDLSGIIEEHAKAVNIRIKARTGFVASTMRFRKPGTTMTGHTCEFRTQIANVDNNSHFIIGVSTDRKIEYRLDPIVWTDISMVIRGWFM